jgi:hypothetical protein
MCIACLVMPETCASRSPYHSLLGLDLFLIEDVYKGRVFIKSVFAITGKRKKSEVSAQLLKVRWSARVES